MALPPDTASVTLTFASPPPHVFVIVPETLKVGPEDGVAAKFTPATSPPFTVTTRLSGAVVNDAFVAFTEYVPFETPANAYVPSPAVVVVRFAAPAAPSVTRTLDAPVTAP